MKITVQAKQVGMTLTELGKNVPDVMFYAFIKLPEGKMSTRKGNVVFMDDLLEEAKAHAAAVVKELIEVILMMMKSTKFQKRLDPAVSFNIVKVSLSLTSQMGRCPIFRRRKRSFRNVFSYKSMLDCP